MGRKGAAERLARRGRELLQAGRASEALDLLQQAASRAPQSPEIQEDLAEAYRQAGKLLPALRAFDRVIELGAASATTWRRTANTLADAGEFAQAIGAYEHSLEKDPSSAEAHHNLARALYRLGQIERAVEHLGKCASCSEAIDPWLSLATVIPGCPSADNRRILEVRRAFASRLKESQPAKSQRRARARQRRSGEPLRLAYLSSFFDQANYMKPVWGLVNHHDRARFHVTLLRDSPAARGMPGYEPRCEDQVLETSGLGNEELISAIADARIDILIDLNGYSAPERLGLFLQPVAPITVAWFNMYATSALPGIDFLVGDDETVRQDELPYYTEKVLCLPLSYLTFQVGHPSPPVVEPPCVRNGYLTFGSLATQYKVCPAVVAVWAEILRRAPSARLLLGNSTLKSIHNRQYVADQFAILGVEQDRLTLFGPADHYRFLQYYDQIDVALDTFPYNGGTTTMEAIWQGVPVLTFDGDRWASRTSQSLLRRTVLESFVAGDARAMVEMAVGLAHDPSTPETLARLRRSLRQELAASEACDTARLAVEMERIYESICP